MKLRLPVAFVFSVTAVFLAGCAFIPPRIVGISPARDARDVASNQEIRVSFDRAMDHGSVESHFELRPKLAGCAESQRCGFAWTNNTLVFSHPGVNFALASTYTVLLHSGYADAQGTRNNLVHSWTFTTESPPALTRVDPGDRATGVSPDRNIVLTFSHPMDAGTMHDAIALEPETPFLLRQRQGGDPTQFEVIPLTLLRPNTRYTLSVEGAEDRHQNGLVGRVESRFVTGPFTTAGKLGYLVAQRGQPAFGVAVVDPHADPFLGQPTPKLIYSLTDLERTTQALLEFDWAPDGTRLVAVRGEKGHREGRLIIVNLKTGQVQDLGMNGSDAVWSPDGTTVVYRNGGDLHRYRLERQEDAVLAQDSGARGPIAFSPGGKSIAYAADDAQGLPRLWILDLDLRARFRLPGMPDPADRPAWSPDGTKLAFRRFTAGGPQLWIYDQAASAYRRAASLDVQSIAWVNDNSSVVVGVGSGTEAALYRVNIFAPGEAGGLLKVTGTREAPNGSRPAAPLYDRRIGYTTIVDGLPQIFLMNADGSRPQQMTTWTTDFPYTGDTANWSPSGR